MPAEYKRGGRYHWVNFRENDMDNSGEKPISLTRERLHAELRRLNDKRAQRGNVHGDHESRLSGSSFAPGTWSLKSNQKSPTCPSSFTGRLQATLYDLLGKEIQKDTFVRGSVTGLFAVGLSDRSHLEVEAIESSTAIRLTLSDLLGIERERVDFRLAMFHFSSEPVQTIRDGRRSFASAAIRCGYHSSH